MMKGNSRIKELIGEMSIKDLKLLQNDLTSKNLTLKLINDILEKYELSKKVCASCGAPINPFSDDKLILRFGQQGFERRAFFCAKDCMNYFLKHFDNYK